MDEYDDGPYWVILLMYGSHDMRHIGFRMLTVVNGTPGFRVLQSITPFKHQQHWNKILLSYTVSWALQEKKGFLKMRN